MRFRISAAVVLIAVALSGRTWGYVFESGVRWPGPGIVMHLQLGNSGALSDGCENWGQCAEHALSIWNAYLSGVEFRVVRDSAAPKRNHDGVNNVFWGDDYYGTSFGPGTLAITLTWWRGAQMTDGDVIFNRAFSWDSYRGPGRSSIFDFRRVAVHEFGHVLGLDHPDEAGQSVQAIMNSRIGNVEVPQNDDIAGLRALYSIATPGPSGPPPIVVEFPPRDQSFSFRTTLEGKYRDGLGRQPVSSYADVEGSVVWTQGYLRYRVNLCGHTDAVNRTFMQIDGQGIQPVCGIPRGTTVVFPPRNETYDFRVQLEGKYRDGLRRGAGATFVDVEGDVVWIQEYFVIG